MLDRRPDNISFEGAVENTEGDEYSTTQIETILGLGDGVAGAELCLSVARKGEQYGI